MKTALALATVVVVSALAAPAAISGPVLDMESFWPNRDANQWLYKQTYQLADWAVNGPDTVLSDVGLRFYGTTTAYGGAEVQNLVEEIPLGGSFQTADSQTGDAFMRTLWAVRPDLRPALAALSPMDMSETAAPQQFWDALFIHGGAFELTADEIVTWRTELSAGKSWLFLVSDISQWGDTFQIQLIPDLSSDVFLTGTVTGFENVTVPAGSYQCLRVDYVVDYGTSVCTAPDNPDAQGSFRAQTTGFVDYAPGIGPVRSEEALSYHDVMGDCGVVPDEPAQRIVLELTNTNVPAISTTWGRMKTRYVPGAEKSAP